ncbi:NAD(P)-binding protein [Candidatus Dependentiae bacterium]|nr:NAD(P)-binding protein [Candidatus Dependentiae bacterium]MBU4387433.1 NAD(P)-binding protein [Candidatus Dependentiae bacterium]MCG2756420.1 NAD(P)-binding protein [Candidatus Dependentiae bacterium]
MSGYKKEDVVIIGAGPAGLTAAFEFIKNNNFNVKVLEKNEKIGGLSRTTEYNGCKFDIGPHHFITQSDLVEVWWKEVMKGEEDHGNRFVQLKRFTRIYYKKHFFYYPLQPMNALLGLSIFESIRCIFSYIKIRLFPIKKVETFQDWVTNKFGYRLFSIFFKTYTEKVWGILCTQISSDWASERIKGFSLSKAIFYAFFGKWAKKNAPRTLSDTFYYPELGAGTLWQKVANQITNSSLGKIKLNSSVVQIKHNNKNIISVLTGDFNAPINSAKKLQEYKAEHFFSTMALRDLILSLDPLPEEKVLNAAKKLVYRGLITLNYIVNKSNISPDHWIYVHEKEVLMGRIGNMNNFSLKMVDDKNHTALSLEYFDFVASSFWNLSDEQLLDIGKNELEQIGFLKKDLILDGMVLRETQAYPVYDKNYKESLKIVLDYLSGFSNLYLMGRNGLHKYNNMDIAMLSAFKVVNKLIDKSKKQDNYFVNNYKNNSASL